MSGTDTVRLEREGPVARVTLNRPDLHNAFDDALIARLTEIADTLGTDDSVRAVVLAGEGKSFCAGADLNWMKRMAGYTEAENVADSLAMAAMFRAWNALPKPVVGRIHGAALGGGVGLVCVVDIAVAAESAVFGFTEVRLGILPAVISPFALARIGPAAARHLFLTGERFDARRALELGLIHRVASAEGLDAAVAEVLQALLAGGARAQARIKSLIPEVTGLTPEDVSGITADAIARARVSPEGQEGIRSFLERRPPSWKATS